MTQKTNHILITLLSFGLLCMLSCKKQKWHTFVNINAKMAHNNAPVSGINWTLIESKIKSSGFLTSTFEPTGWELSGETDAAGLSADKFHARKNSKYHYEIYFDYSDMDVPEGTYDIVEGPPTFDIISLQKDNAYDIRILPNMSLNFHYKNTNCFDSNDTFRYKSYNSDEILFVNQGQIDTWPWTESTVFNGCADYSSSGNKLAGQYIYIWEATRNGIITSGIDTFYVEPGGNNLIEMFW